MAIEERARPHVRELPAGYTGAAFSAMHELRPHFDDKDAFVAQIDDVQRPQGYRLVGVFVDELEDAVAAAGFRLLDSLSSGHFMYVDDLVTMRVHRGRGYARLLMTWLIDEAARVGCDQFQLDSATHRHAAHRLYLGSRMDITAFHFGLNLSRGDAD